jgi:hypothetical protein
VLSPEVRISDVDGAHWVNLLALMRRTNVVRRGWLIVFVDPATDDGVPPRVVRALRSGAGEIDPATVEWHGPDTPLDELKRAHEVDRVIVLEDGALPSLFHDAEGKLDAGMDYVEQILTVLRAGRDKMGRGLWVEPRTLSRFPIPSYPSVQATFDRLWPDGKTLVFYVLDGDDVHTSLILGKRGGDIDLVTTHAALAADVKIGRGWRREYKDVLTAVKDRFGPAHLALFLDLDTWKRAAVGPRGTISREIARRHIVIDPAPGWLLLLVGGDALAGVVQTGAGVFGKLMPREWQDKMKAMAAPFAGLGFDPIEMWKTWRGRGERDRS